jgi:hypothetical protein
MGMSIVGFNFRHNQYEIFSLLKAVLWRGMLKIMEIEMTREFKGDCFV